MSPLKVAVAALFVVPANPASAQEVARFKLDAETGCWHYFGDAVEFVGRVRASAYIGIQMVTVRDGFPVPFADEPRIPVSEAPEAMSARGPSWFGPMPKTGDHSFSFAPRAEFGSTALVSICGRSEPPPEQSGH